MSIVSRHSSPKYHQRQLHLDHVARRTIEKECLMPPHHAHACSHLHGLRSRRSGPKEIIPLTLKKAGCKAPRVKRIYEASAPRAASRNRAPYIIRSHNYHKAERVWEDGEIVESKDPVGVQCLIHFVDS